METLVVSDGTRTVEELLTALERGQRVVVRSQLPWDHREATLQWDGRAFHCDTPTGSHTHERRAEMRTCLERQGYASE